MACVATSRTLMAPPTVPGATYVGSKQCADCHTDVSKHFASSTHGRIGVKSAEGKDAVGCEGCHGPASLHVKSGKGGSIVNPGKSPEVCFQCHMDKRGEFRLASTHPVMNGKMSCSDCHNPHKGTAVTESTTSLAGYNESCVKCHTAQGMPYAFEHEASREGCVVCHSPHGSPNAKMLKARNANLCLQCHFQQQSPAGQILIGGRDHAAFLSRGTCWSGGCHEAVHGSHVSSSLRF